MSSHLIILPVLIPVLAAVLMLLPPLQASIRAQRFASGFSVLALCCVNSLLIYNSALQDPQQYLVGNWPEPFGIVLVLDRLSALFLMINAVLAVGIWLHSCGGEDEKSGFFHPLFQFLLMGLNGAFLTGDLFNLFVFFEVLLISSYALLIYGGGKARVRATLHYVLFNLLGSALFLLALALLYSSLGSLNMADLALRISQADSAQLGLIQAAAGLLLVVFGLKSALFPFHFWLSPAYAQANAMVAALFAIMTKVGIYSFIRVFSQLFGEEAQLLAGFGRDLMFWGGLATMLLAIAGALASQDLRRLVAYLVLMSAGTLLAVLAVNSVSSTAAVLYYAIHSTLITAAMCLVVDAIARQRGAVGGRLVAGRPMPDANILGWLFCLMVLSILGMPPLSGAIAKLWLLQASGTHPEMLLFWTMLLLGSAAVLIALSRAGTTLFWRQRGQMTEAHLSRWRILAMVWLLGASPLLVLFADPISQFCLAAARQIHQPLTAVGVLP